MEVSGDPPPSPQFWGSMTSDLDLVHQHGLITMNFPLTTLETPSQPFVSVDLPPLTLTPEGLAELYSFLQYLQFRHQTDLEAAIDFVEEELDILDCATTLAANEPTIPWSQVKQDLGLV
jgi:hypothetical protein